MTERPSAARPRRRWLRYSLRSLLALVVLTSMALGWIESRRRYYARQVAATEAFADAEYSFRTVGPLCLQWLWGEKAFRSVTGVSFTGGADRLVEDDDLAVLSDLPDLEFVDVADSFKDQNVHCAVTDRGLLHLRNL